MKKQNKKVTKPKTSTTSEGNLETPVLAVFESGDSFLLHKSVRERLQIGQHQRKQMKRIEHAEWHEKLREQKPADLLRASTEGRLPELIKLKDKLMAESAFAYFRGAAPVMAYDLSRMGNAGILTQICGDAHVRNLGVFEAEDGRLVFDINDFDETIAGPFEWDVKRMATSLILAGREAKVKSSECRAAVSSFLALYRRTMLTLASMPVLAVARYQVHRLKNVTPILNILRTAQRATPIKNLQTLTEPAKPTPGHAVGRTLGMGARVFKNQPPMLRRVTGEEAQRVVDSLSLYEQSLLPERRRFFAQYQPLDVAFKVVGTGSIGLRDYCIYLEGNGSKDPLFLQIKEEAASAYMSYLGGGGRPKQHEGQRVVEGERSMQLQSDPFLGWTTLTDEDGTSRDFLVRQLNDHKGSVDIDRLQADELMEYAGVCGEMLARGHARGGDAAMLSGYIGVSNHFDQAIASFAEAYAEQTQRDWKSFAQEQNHAAKAAKQTKAAKKIEASRKAGAAKEAKASKQTKAGEQTKATKKARPAKVGKATKKTKPAREVKPSRESVPATSHA